MTLYVLLKKNVITLQRFTSNIVDQDIYDLIGR